MTTEAKKVLDDDDKPISDYGVSKGTTLLAKDLGYQICAWASSRAVADARSLEDSRAWSTLRR